MARTASVYSSTIDGFNVETATKYKKVGDTTQCSLFARDVMNAMSAALPGTTANEIADALYGNSTPGWYSVTFLVAQQRGNLGYPTIGIRRGPGTDHGHVVVVRPKGSSITTLKEVQVAQAGNSNFNSKTINYSWISTELAEVKFYTHD